MKSAEEGLSRCPDPPYELLQHPARFPESFALAAGKVRAEVGHRQQVRI